MSQAAASVSATAGAAEIPMNTFDNIFQFVHDVFNQYRSTFLFIAGTTMVGWIYNRFWVNRKFFTSRQTMEGKTVLITGGNAGIGYETAKDLLQRGARVIIACRNLDKGRNAVRQLHLETECDEKLIRLMKCDLSSFESIRDFAKTYLEEEERLDVLICNAGLAWSPDVVTKDGFNSVVQSNYLGHFLLTNLLVEKLKSCRPSRIINVSSGAHKAVRSIDWSDAFTQFKTWRLFGGYSYSKAFQILSSHKLKRDLLPHGVNVFCVHPGWVWTSIQTPMQEAIGLYGFLLFYPLLRWLKIPFAKTPKTGARTTIFCAVEPKLENSSDLYFENCVATRMSSLCVNDELAEELWTRSCQAVGL